MQLSSRLLRCIAMVPPRPAFRSETKCTSGIYLESSARRIGLSENRSSVCNPRKYCSGKAAGSPGRREGEKKRNITGKERSAGWMRTEVVGWRFFFFFFSGLAVASRCGGVNACLLAPLKWSVRYGGRIDCTRREPRRRNA